MTLPRSKRENHPPEKPFGNPPKKTPVAATKRSLTKDQKKRWDRIRKLARADQRQNTVADHCASVQWTAMDLRGPLEFPDRPTADELYHRQRREELRGLPRNEVNDNIVEHEERRRDELRAIVVPDPEGDDHIAARLQRAHQRKDPEPKPDSG